MSGPQQIPLPRQMFNGVHEDIGPTILAAAAIMVVLSLVPTSATNALAARFRRMRAA